MFDLVEGKSVMEIVDYFVSMSLFGAMFVLSLLCLVLLAVAVVNAYRDVTVHAQEPEQIPASEHNTLVLA